MRRRSPLSALMVALCVACNATSEFQEPIIEPVADAGPPRPGSPFGDRPPPPEAEPSPPPTEDPPEPPMCVSSLPMQGGGPAPTYFKASNTYVAPYNGDALSFGGAVALSADGTTMAVGARYEPSAGQGVGAFQDDVSAPGAGAVYVFRRRDGVWGQEAYVKAFNNTQVTANSSTTRGFFGWSVALSADGNVLAVGAPSESGTTVGVGGRGTQGPEAFSSGAAYVFKRTGDKWAHEEYFKASNARPHDAFGRAVTLSANGTTLAVGAPFERGTSTGVNGSQIATSLEGIGAAYVFQKGSAGWAQEAYVKPALPQQKALFGVELALDATGDTLVVGAPGNPVSGVPGHAYVFERTMHQWAASQHLQPQVRQVHDSFGSGIAISADRQTIAIGACNEPGPAPYNGVGIVPAPVPNVGAAYVFTRSAAGWTQTARLTPAPVSGSLGLGLFALALSADGTTLAAGATGDASATTGINGNPCDTSAGSSGAAFMFRRKASVWEQTAYVKASNTLENTQFGSDVALSADGSTLVTGSEAEESGSVGVNGYQWNHWAPGSGAVYLHSFP